MGIMVWKRKSELIQKREEAQLKKTDHKQHAETLAALDAIKQAYISAHKNDNANEGWKSFREYLTIALIALTVLFTSITYVVFKLQLHEMRKVYGPINKQAEAAMEQTTAMNAQLEEMKRQSEAADRASTSGRAFVWITTPDPPPFEIYSAHDPKIATANFTTKLIVRNIGETPAIITDIAANLIQAPVGGDRPQDPTQIPWGRWRDSRIRGANQARSCFLEPASACFFRPSSPSYDQSIEQAIIDGKSKPVELTLHFTFIDVDYTLGGMQQFAGGGATDPTTILDNAFYYWLYVVIHYRDVYGRSRETSFYASKGPPNTGFLLEGDKYNYAE